MCGITGIFSFNNSADSHKNEIVASVEKLKHRGPDATGVWTYNNVGLGHSRLSVIDTNETANQPMHSSCGRYHIVFNGEIYNYQTYRNKLKDKYNFVSNSDTEVLLYMYAEYGEDFLKKLNGCFSFAIFDSVKNELIIARDRFGIKPLLVYADGDKLIFASEMAALMQYNISKNIDFNSLNLYFMFNYIPGPVSILKSVSKLTPGTYLKISNKRIEKKQFYTIPYNRESYNTISYEQAKEKLKNLIFESVKNRMLSDVPLGSFLSGGIDSSIVAGIASKYNKNINTFSVGYKDEAFFDETEYALEVAKHFGTKHHVFKLSNNDLYEHLHDILNFIDEPFADSSAIPVYILSKLTRKHVTVALSGDGADEIFAGYNKHMAYYKSINSTYSNLLIKFAYTFTKNMPSSRNSHISNKIRQINKYAKGLKLPVKERYFLWARLFDENENKSLFDVKPNKKFFDRMKHELTEVIESNDLNDSLLADVKLVLPGDMLFKVDKMSMANSLEVRTPFLDHNIVDFAFNLPASYKINGKIKKRILQDAFKDFLPSKIYNRPKHGFEVPLLKWFKTELWKEIDKKWLNEELITEQGIFNVEHIKQLKKQLHSNNPADVSAKIWALIVFQNWWEKHKI